MERIFFILVLVLSTSCTTQVSRDPNKLRIVTDPDSLIIFPELPSGNLGREILYGREILINTAFYFGRKGVIKPIFSNSVQCQNCHLDAGTRLYGNHLLNTFKKYPGYYARVGKPVSLENRIELCIDDHYRNRKGKIPSKEMNALKTYLKWLSKSKINLSNPEKSTFFEFAFPSRKSSSARGKELYSHHCLRCHSGSPSVLTPPLWGKDGYSIHSPFFQNFRLAQFIRANMPLGSTPDNPILSEEEALDIAVYVNSSQLEKRWGDRKLKFYPQAKEKPFDYPFGPYKDGFNEMQHRIGPFLPISEKQK